MRLGKISWHLHTNKSDASLNVNMSWLWASSNANGTPYHRQDYQQLQTADERPNHSWNVADGFQKGFWWHSAGRSKNRAKRDKLHFCTNTPASPQDKGSQMRAPLLIFVHRKWTLIAFELLLGETQSSIQANSWQELPTSPLSSWCETVSSAQRMQNICAWISKTSIWVHLSINTNIWKWH